jgi:hypothetical protein
VWYTNSVEGFQWRFFICQQTPVTNSKRLNSFDKGSGKVGGGRLFVSKVAL